MTMPDDIKAHNRELIAQFRADGGVPDGRPLLLLTTTGAKTGRSHTTPMMYVPTATGCWSSRPTRARPRIPTGTATWWPTPPSRWRSPATRTRPTAAPLRGEERDREFAEICEKYPFFAEHQSKVSRTIPVVALVRRS